jgi:hypothetical protein
LGKYYNEICKYFMHLGPNVTNDGGGIDDWKQVNENFAIRLEAKWGPVYFDRYQVFECLVKVVHETKQPVSQFRIDIFIIGKDE